MTENQHGQGSSSSALYILGEINGKVDLLLLANTDQEGRIRSLEKSRNYHLGFVAAISAVFTFVSTYIFKGHA